MNCKDLHQAFFNTKAPNLTLVWNWNHWGITDTLC